ncbi:ATP-dependent helicase HrpB [Aliiglaciecola sp. LCG003]|uniref:ATP-dependent helicase HrpB n=1 Tax=Aliiglaciecola sp. LCG003 TaxID=3053655 RepID=UPI002573931C|nr:ATP-dependent helicase HrpB [Aliiglaciecola sp. LCG003]WJG09975.1 ATP-dependent helicase HrpB [Aliiglaciecola sp. LCG003]
MVKYVLPVESCWPALSESISEQDVILVAPPGAGKSTYLPLKLLELFASTNLKIVMLQPRQIAVRAIANYLAQQLGEDVGQTVGYRMRGEAKTSSATRLEIVTEGLLTRMLQNDPELPGIGLVIFDEFHERNVHADFSLALCLDTQAALRPDLRLLVMSATLDVGEIGNLLPDAKLLQSEGKRFDVDVIYTPAKAGVFLAQHCTAIIIQALQQHEGDMLVFLPGAREIKLVEQLCQVQLQQTVNIFPLYGNLNKQQQQAAIQPSPAGQRKIVLATNIAETSLTIDGIKIVVDSGQEKVSSFNLQRGISSLTTMQISKASATQRAGRAGRLAAGHCYRLWSKDAQQRLIAQRPPEILQMDISSLYLEALVWGEPLADLRLLDIPSTAQIQHAEDLLKSLGALDEQGKLTAVGRAFNGLGCHPRLACMLIQSEALGAASQLLACLLVAVLEGKPISALRDELCLSQHLNYVLSPPQQPIYLEAKRWASRLRLNWSGAQIKKALPTLVDLLLLGFPDQIGQSRGAGRFLLASGTGVMFHARQQHSNLMVSPWLIVCQMTLGRDADGLIQLAEPISESQLMGHADNLIKHSTQHYWDDTNQRVVSREVKMLGAILVSETRLAKTKNADYSEIIIDTLLTKGFGILNWSTSVQQLLLRVNLAAEVFGSSWPDFTPAGLRADLSEWLSPYLAGVSSLEQLIKLDWHSILKNQLEWSQQQFLDQHFPTQMQVATGQSCRLHYSKNGQVELQTKMQQVYGWQDSPSIAQGRVKVTLSLLSPPGTELQKTSDLAGFWQGSYKEVQKEMKGRYPKHFWPDDPANARPTSKTKKYM